MREKHARPAADKLQSVAPTPEVARFLREQPPLAIPTRVRPVPPRGSIAYAVLGYRVISKGSPR